MSYHHATHAAMLKKLLCSVFIVLCSGAFAEAMAQSRGGGRGANVETAPAQMEQLRSATPVAATVIALNSYKVTAPFAGIVSIADVRAGSQVKKGAVIGEIDATDEKHQLQLLNEQLNHIELQLSQIKTNLSVEKQLEAFAIENRELAARRLQRAEQLSQKQVVSADTVENATQSLISAEQQIVSREQAQMRLEQQGALLRSDKSRISLQREKLKSEIMAARMRSPIDGQIISLNSSVQYFVREGDVIAEIQDVNSFEIAADVPSELIRYLTVGQRLTAFTPTGQQIDATLRAVLPQHNQRTGTRAVRITPQTSLPVTIAADGAQLSVQVPDRSAEAVVTIPKDGLLPVDGGYVVYVAEQGKAVRRSVEIGGTSKGRVIILSGISDKEQIIVKGNEGLSDGDALRQGGGGGRPAPAAAAPRPGADAQKWALSWQTRRGESEAELVLSKAANLYDGAPVEVIQQGDNIQFTGEATLPFGIIELKFDGMIDGGIMSGMVRIIGLPNGNEPELAFQGKRINP